MPGDRLIIATLDRRDACTDAWNGGSSSNSGNGGGRRLVQPTGSSPSSPLCAAARVRGDFEAHVHAGSTPLPHTHIYVYMCVCMYACMYVRAYYRYIYTYVYTHTEPDIEISPSLRLQTKFKMVTEKSALSVRGVGGQCQGESIPWVAQSQQRKSQFLPRPFFRKFVCIRIYIYI